MLPVVHLWRNTYLLPHCAPHFCPPHPLVAVPPSAGAWVLIARSHQALGNRNDCTHHTPRTALKCSAQRKKNSKTGAKIHKWEFILKQLCQHFESWCYSYPTSQSNRKHDRTKGFKSTGMWRCVMNTVSQPSRSESSPAQLWEPQTLHYTSLWGGYSMTCPKMRKSTNHKRQAVQLSTTPPVT